MKKNKHVSKEQVMRQYNQILNRFESPIKYPIVDKKFMFNLVPCYLKNLEEIKSNASQFIELIAPMKSYLNKEGKLSENTQHCLKNFPKYKDFLNTITKYIKVKEFDEADFIQQAIDCCNNTANICFSSENENSPDLAKSALCASLYTLGSVVSWYKTDRVVYSFKEKTTLEALDIMFNNSNFNGAEFLDLLEVGESKAFYIVDKDISFAGLISRREDCLQFNVFDKDYNAFHYILATSCIPNITNITEFFNHFFSTVSCNCVETLLALSGFVYTEEVGRIYPFPTNAKDKTLEEKLDLPPFKNLIRLVAIGYYMTYSQKIKPEVEEVHVINSKENSYRKNIIRHYDIEESTIKIIKPKIKYEYPDGVQKGAPKRPHYRRPHSHRFWEGSGENKRLVKHLVQGVCVNGYTLTPDDKYPKPRINNVI